jgi:hypothetical protein
MVAVKKTAGTKRAAPRAVVSKQKPESIVRADLVKLELWRFHLNRKTPAQSASSGDQDGLYARCVVRRYNPDGRRHIGFVDINYGKTSAVDWGVDLNVMYFYVIDTTAKMSEQQGYDEVIKNIVNLSVWQKFRDFFNFTMHQTDANLPEPPLVPEEIVLLRPSKIPT